MEEYEIIQKRTAQTPESEVTKALNNYSNVINNRHLYEG